MSNTIEHLVAMANDIGAFFDGEVGRAAVKMLPTPAARWIHPTAAGRLTPAVAIRA